MNIKTIISEQLLLEIRKAKIITTIADNFTVVMNIEDTLHYNARKHRHEFVGKNTKVPVYIDDFEVVEMLEKAKKNIAGKILNNAIRDGESFVLADKTGPKKITLAIAPKMLKDKTQWELTIITIYSELASGRPFNIRYDNNKPQLLIKV